MAGAPRCPHCGQPVRESRHGVPLTPLKARIFDVVQRAGRDGIASDDLFALVYSERERPIKRKSINSHIWQINDALMDTGVRIRGGQGDKWHPRWRMETARQ